MGRLDYSIELPRRTIDDVQMPNLPDHLTYIEPGYGIGDMLAEIAKNIRAGKLAQVEENLKMAQAQNYQAEMADRQSRAAREQQELIDTRSAQQKLADLLNTPGAITNPELRAPLIAAFSRLGGAGANLAQATFGASDRERLQGQRFDRQGVLQDERLDAQRGMQSERIGAQRGMQTERLGAQASVANLRDATMRRGQDMLQARTPQQILFDQNNNAYTADRGEGASTVRPTMIGAPLPTRELPSRLAEGNKLRGVGLSAGVGRADSGMGGVDQTGPLAPPTGPDNQMTPPAPVGVPVGEQLTGRVKGQGSNKTLQDYASTYFKKAQQDANTEHGANTTKAATIVEMFKKDVGSQEQAALAGNPDAQVVYDKELIRALAKLTDPDSVIRESEQKFYGETGSSLAQKVDGWMAYINGGPNRVIYQPGQREQMRQQLEAIVEFWRDKQASRDAMVKKNFHYYMSGRGTPEEVEAAWQGVSKEGSMGGRKMTADEWLKENP